MSDSTAFIAGCATTGAAALMLLLARMSIDGSTAGFIDSAPAPAADAIAPVPAPPPPAFPAEAEETTQDLEAELEQQQEITSRLQNQLDNQQRLIRDLEDQVQAQEQEARLLADRLEDYRLATTDLSDRQVRLEGEQQDVGQTQNSLVWVGAGLLLMLLAGGGGVMILVVLWMSQQSKQSSSPPTNTVIYSPRPAPPAYHYDYYDPGYGPEMLPPTPLRSASVPQPYPQQYR